MLLLRLFSSGRNFLIMCASSCFLSDMSFLEGWKNGNILYLPPEHFSMCISASTGRCTALGLICCLCTVLRVHMGSPVSPM